MAKDEFYGKGSKRISGDFLEPSTPVLFEDGGPDDETRKEMRKRQKQERKTHRKKRRATRKQRRLTKKINRRKKKTTKLEEKLKNTESVLIKKEDKGEEKTPKVEEKVTPEKKVEKKKTKSIDDMSFSEAYRTQRDANKKAGISHYGDDSGYFTWRGKEYNTESKSEKEKREGKKKKKKEEVVVKKKEENKTENKTENKNENKEKKNMGPHPKHDQDGDGIPAVSYTHLTLPTILRV